MFRLMHEPIIRKPKRGERGQGSIEYVLVILGVVLFMVVAAFGLRSVLSGATSKISSWISSVNTPSVP